MKRILYIILFLATTISQVPIPGFAPQSASAQIPYVMPMRIGAGAIGFVFAKWSSTNKASVVSLSNGDLTATGTNGNTGLCIATIGKSSGKWYWEVTIDIKQIGNNNELVGLTTIVPNSSNTQNLAGFSKQISRRGSAWCITYNIGGGVVNAGASCTAQASGQVVGFALDMTNGTLDMYLNGSHIGSQVTGITTGEVWYPAMCSDGAASASKVTANFGATAFIYTPPTGYNPGIYN